MQTKTKRARPLDPLQVERAIRHTSLDRTRGPWHIAIDGYPGDRNAGDLGVALSMASLHRQKDVVTTMHRALAEGHAMGIGHWGAFLIYREGHKPAMGTPKMHHPGTPPPT